MILTWLLLGVLSVAISTYAISVFNNIARYLNTKKEETNTIYLICDPDSIFASVIAGILLGPITLVFAIAALVDVYDISRELK